MLDLFDLILGFIMQVTRKQLTNNFKRPQQRVKRQCKEVMQNIDRDLLRLSNHWKPTKDTSIKNNHIDSWVKAFDN